MGCISLETPDMIAEEEEIVAQQRQEKAEREALLKVKKHSSRDMPAKHH